MASVLALAVQNKKYHADNRTIPGPADLKLAVLQIHRLVRENLKIMTALFLIAIAVFIYMIYVLIKPEKF